MNSTSALSIIVILLVCTLAGCASFDNDLRDAWRGVPVSIDDVPEGAITPEHRNALRAKGATIEKCDDGIGGNLKRYRFVRVAGTS